MIDGKSVRQKLIGSDDERAVSPVIGVILMVAITVILAAVIAAFVLDMGNDMGGEANAGVETSVDNSDNEVEVSVTSMGNSEEIILRGDLSNIAAINGDSSRSSYDESSDALTKTGESITVKFSSGSGTVTVVAITEDGTETQISSQEYDF